MSDLGQSAVQEIAPDNVADDVRSAINELKVGSTEPPLDVVIDKGEVGRVRDEAGKFVAKPKDETPPKRETLTLKDKPVVQETPAAVAGIITDPAQQIGVEPPKPIIEPPKGWSAEAKAKWAEVPEALQREAVRREEALTKQLFQHDEARDFGRKLQEVTTPYLPTLRAEGADIPKAFENYLQTSHVLRAGTDIQKSLALHAIAQRFNVDLNLAHQQGGISPQQLRQDSEVAELRRQVLELKQERQQQETSSLEQQVAAWASSPGHEHFDKVRTRMGRLMDDDPSLTLDTAYDQAIWSHPEIRPSLVAAQSKAAEDQRSAELKAKADAAKSAAVSVKGAPGGSRPLNGAGSTGSIADDLRAAIAEHRGHV